MGDSKRRVRSRQGAPVCRTGFQVPFYFCSLGVEPVDRDTLHQPPRRVTESILGRGLLLRVLLSATVILGGTLFIYWREVRLLPTQSPIGWRESHCRVRENEDEKKNPGVFSR